MLLVDASNEAAEMTLPAWLSWAGSEVRNF